MNQPLPQDTGYLISKEFSDRLDSGVKSAYYKGMKKAGYQPIFLSPSHSEIIKTFSTIKDNFSISNTTEIMRGWHSVESEKPEVIRTEVSFIGSKGNISQ